MVSSFLYKQRDICPQSPQQLYPRPFLAHMAPTISEKVDVAPFRFLDLPAEIRNSIYQFCLINHAHSLKGTRSDDLSKQVYDFKYWSADGDLPLYPRSSHQTNKSFVTSGCLAGMYTPCFVMDEGDYCFRRKVLIRVQEPDLFTAN